MTDILSMINRLQDTAIDFTLSGRERDRDELHAARRAIMEAFDQAQKATEALNICIEQDDKREARLRAREAELVKALTKCQSALSMLIAPTNEITSGIGIQSAWAICVEAETAARAAIHPSLEQE